MKASVIMSTYNAVQWLEKVVWGFSVQTVTDFEIIIADDGSDAKTKEKIDELRKLIVVPIIHIWHEDHGFQKTKILNKAILASTTDYLIFIKESKNFIILISAKMELFVFKHKSSIKKKSRI